MMVFLVALPLGKAHVTLLPSGKAISLSKARALSCDVPYFGAWSPSKGSMFIVELLLLDVVLQF